MRVLIAYDGSPGAEQAIALAGSLRWPSGSTLRVVSVVEPPVPQVMGVRHVGPVPAAEGDPEAVEIRQRDVSDVAARLSTEDVQVEGAVLRGRPATVLVDDAASFGADLVMGGSRGHGRVARLLLGSVAAEVVDTAPCPVLVARTSQIRGLVLAVDGSPSSEAAESLLSTWPIFDGIAMHVISVADVMEPVQFGLAPARYHEAAAAHAGVVAEQMEHHSRIADEAAARLRAAGRPADATMRTGRAAGEITAAAAERGADLVAIGSRGRSGLERMVLGSVARSVLNDSAGSVLIVRAGFG